MSTHGALRLATHSLVGASNATSTFDPFNASRLTSALKDWSTSWIIACKPRPPRLQRQPCGGQPFGLPTVPDRAQSASPMPVPVHLVGAGRDCQPPSDRTTPGGSDRMPNYLSPGVYVE